MHFAYATHCSHDKHDVSISLIESWKAFQSSINHLDLYLFDYVRTHGEIDSLYTVKVYERRGSSSQNKNAETLNLC